MEVDISLLVFWPVNVLISQGRALIYTLRWYNGTEQEDLTNNGDPQDVEPMNGESNHAMLTVKLSE